MDEQPNNCQNCQSPLGQESKDQGFAHCHNCRLCKRCGLSISAAESRQVVRHGLPIHHARCLVNVGQLPIEARLDLANIVRLIDQEVTRVKMGGTLDDKLDCLRYLQSQSAAMSILVDLDKRKFTAILNQGKQEQDKKTAKQQVDTSTRPANKPPDAADEQAIAWFGKTYGIKERSLILKEMKNRDKAVEQLHKQFHVSYEAALATVTDQLEKRFKVGSYAPLAQPTETLNPTEKVN